MNKNDRAADAAGRLPRFLGGTSVFWQFFLLLAVILALAVVILSMSGRRYEAVLTESYLRQTESSFRQNCGAFSASVRSTYGVPTAVENTEDYANLRRVAAGQLPENSRAMILARVNGIFRDSVSLTRLEDAKCFLYLPVAEAVCTVSGGVDEAGSYFSEALCYEGYTAEELTDLLRETRMFSFLPEGNVEIDGAPSDCLTLLERPTTAGPVMGVMYPADAVLDYFQFDTLPDTSYFYLDDGAGTTLLSVGEKNGGECYEFSCNLTGIRGRATIGVPKAYITSLLAPTQRFGTMLVGIVLLVGLALCALLSSVGTMPLRRLLRRYSVPDGETSHRNEIRRLADLLSSSQMEWNEVQRILSSSVLIRVFSGGVLTEAEEAKLLDTYPALSGPCRIAIVHTTEPVEGFGQTDVTELLREHLPETFACGTVNNLETGILLPDDEEALHTLASVLSGIGSQLGVDGLTVLCGVSAPFTGVQAAYAAVRQARFSVPIRESSYIEVYSTEDTGGARPGVYSWLTHERLYQAVMKQDREDTLGFIRGLAAEKYSLGAAKEVFYNVRFVVRSTAHELDLPLPEADAMEYREEMRQKENFRQLETLVSTLFDRMRVREEMDAEQTLDGVVRHIREHFSDPDLSAAAVAARFGLPVKSVYAAVRDKTEMNFNEYLVSVRMKEAAKLLCTTARSVDEIGASCGYPAQSTFYRVFKKYYGESPNRYRSLH